MSDGTGGATPGEVALAHRYRLWLLYCLFAYANPMYLPDIARQLTIWEGADRGADVGRAQLIVYDSLYHDHLPALREAALVTYHQQDDEIELGPAAERVEPLIRERLATEIDELLDAEGRAIDADSVPG